MRTDSTRVSQEALTAVREHIGAAFPKESLPESPRFFKSRRDTQDAHEAIRPTYLDLPPDEVAKHVAADEAKLYRLIWQRFVASQMAPAVYDTTSADITAGRAVYRASGSTLKFAGYLAAYGISDEDEEETDKDTPKLPPLTEGETLEARRGRAREEGDAAAAALQRGVARQVPRGERHRPPVDLRRDPAQDRGAALRPPPGPPLHPDRPRPHGHRAPDPVLRRFLRDLLHGAHGRGPRRGRGGQALVDQGAGRLRQDLHARPEPRPEGHGVRQGRDPAGRGEEAEPLRRARRSTRSARRAARS